jgi:hypothetical protein
MQQSCTYGSVRGASGNRCPYRDKARSAAVLCGAKWNNQLPMIVWSAQPNGLAAFVCVWRPLERRPDTRTPMLSRLEEPASEPGCTQQPRV